MHPSAWPCRETSTIFRRVFPEGMLTPASLRTQAAYPYKHMLFRRDRELAVVTAIDVSDGGGTPEPCIAMEIRFYIEAQM